MSEIEPTGLDHDPDAIDWEHVKRSALFYACGSWLMADMLHRRLGDDGMPEAVGEAMVDFMHTARYVDIALDDPSVKESGREIVGGYAAYMLSDSGVMPVYLERCEAAAVSLHGYIRSHDPAGRQQWAGSLSEFVDVTGSLQQATTPREYSRNTRLEGLLTANMIAALLPEATRIDPRSQPAIRWLGRIGQAGNVLDSLWDLNDDIRDGLIVNPQPWKLRAELAKTALRDLGPAFGGSKIGDWVVLGKILAGRSDAAVKRI